MLGGKHVPRSGEYVELFAAVLLSVNEAFASPRFSSLSGGLNLI